MRKKLFSFSMLAGVSAFLFGAFGLTACGSDSFQAANVKLNKYTLNMAVGDREQIRVSVSPKSYSNAELRWFTSNDNVATVNASGYVFAVGEGTATITASIAGGYADCLVNVSGTGGGEGSTDYLILSPANGLTVEEGASKTLKAQVPATETVTFTVSSGTDKIQLSPNGNETTVIGVAEGSATITVKNSSDLTKFCNVTVTKAGGGGETSDLDIGVDKNLHYSGNYTIGYTPGQEDVLTRLVGDFNSLTGSSITVTPVNFPENKAADNLGNDAENGPHIFPYASDQTLRLYSQRLLMTLAPNDALWIKDKMGSDALSYATLKGIGEQVGFPFAADNGYVMYYDKSLVTESEIDTIPELFAKADELDYDVDYDPTDGFYGAGLLMSYTEKDLYQITVKAGGTYTAKGNFNSDEGLQGARAVAKVFTYGPAKADEVPGANTEVLATITTCARAAEFKRLMGANYACAPLPFVSEDDQTRLGVYLGYKFFGINAKRAKTDAEATILTNICRFLTSEYAQKVRYEMASVKPTVLNEEVNALCANEPHIKALNQQIADGGVTPLGPVDTKLWNGIMNCAQSIKDIAVGGAMPTDDQLKGFLSTLDTAVRS